MKEYKILMFEFYAEVRNSLGRVARSNIYDFPGYEQIIAKYSKEGYSINNIGINSSSIVVCLERDM